MIKQRISPSVLLLTFIMVCCLSACSNPADNDKGLPEFLTIGILPDESKAELLKRYTPLFTYLSDALGIPYKLIIPSDYAELMHHFEHGDIDMAYFGGLTFIQANHLYDAVPLVMRDIDVYFTSYFITHPELSANKLSDFKDFTFSFGSKLSTSGHLMPRLFLQQKGIIPEEYFNKVLYSGSHDKTAFAVRNKSADLGAINSKILDKMVLDGRIKESETHILMETPPFPDYVWALQASIDQHSREKIINAFLSLSPANKYHAKILSGVDAGGFLPASTRDFLQLHDIARQIGLFKGGNNLL